jgi:hypothetical protein
MSFAEQMAVAANVAQVLGAIGIVGGIFYAAAQLAHSASTSRAAFLLQLEDMSHDYDAIHAKLRPKGAWAEKGAGPATPLEWVHAEDYLKFFEHCEILMRQGSLDPRVFWQLFGYRVKNILVNELIVRQKLIGEREYWQLFWALLRRFGLTSGIPRTQPASNEAAHASQQVPPQHA